MINQIESNAFERTSLRRVLLSLVLGALSSLGTWSERPAAGGRVRALALTASSGPALVRHDHQRLLHASRAGLERATSKPLPPMTEGDNHMTMKLNAFDIRIL